MNETKSPWPGLRRRDDLPFIIHRSSFIIVFAVSFYIVAVVILFSRFFWSPPLSQVSLYMLLLSAICCGVAVRDPSRALTVLSLGVPLVGGMPHLAQGPCPPPLLMMIAAFAVGWLINQRRQTVNREDGASRSATYIMILLLFFLVSGALTAWRYLSYAPVGGRPMGDSVINVRGETALQAAGGVWQTLVVTASGPLLFLLTMAIPLDQSWLGRWSRRVLYGLFGACLIGLVQLLFAPSLGNDPFWVKHHRINATFPDPNALGTYLALVFPLTVVMALGAGDRLTRWLSAATTVLAIVMLAGSGSRTGAAGVALSVLLFPAIMALRFRVEGEAFRRRVLFGTAVLFIVLAAFAPIEPGTGGSRYSLFGRLARTRDRIAHQGLLTPFIQDRLARWEAAVHVTSRHPFAGIGVGAFRYEVENFGRLGRQNWPGFDNTNNFYLQIAAELGVIGLALVVGVLAAITAAIVRVIRSPQLRGETCLVYLALATSWVVFLVLFLTGPHLLFEQNQAMFWLIAAVFMKQHESLLTPQPTRLRWMIALGGVGLIAVTAFQLADGFGKLSPARRRTVLGLAHTQGFYPRETEETGRRFRWTRERALISVPTTHAEIRVEMIARHPDLATSPVGVLLTVDGKQPRRFEISKTEWQWIRYPVPSGVSSPANLEIQVERTWRPDDWVHNKDKRTLGVGVARIENADPSEPLPP